MRIFPLKITFPTILGNPITKEKVKNILSHYTILEYLKILTVPSTRDLEQEQNKNFNQTLNPTIHRMIISKTGCELVL